MLSFDYHLLNVSACCLLHVHSRNSNFAMYPRTNISRIKSIIRRYLINWGLVRHICVSKLAIIDSNNGLLLGRRRAIIWTNAEILLIGLLETNCSEIVIEISTFSFKKMLLKMSSGTWRPSCLGHILLMSSSRMCPVCVCECLCWLTVAKYVIIIDHDIPIRGSIH